MKLKKLVKLLLILSTISVNVGCDQISKKIIRETIVQGENIKFLDNRLTLTRVENTGAFLSLGDSLPPAAKKILLNLLPLLALISGLIYLLTKLTMSRILVTGACFVIGGGIGNLIDRFAYGSVTDFLHLDLGILQTGVFNMADVSIMIGAALFFFGSLSKNDNLTNRLA